MINSLVFISSYGIISIIPPPTANAVWIK